jgi:hypothetical protein
VHGLSQGARLCLLFSGACLLAVRFVALKFSILYVVQLLWRFSKAAIELRLLYLAEQPIGGPSHAVMVTDIPGVAAGTLLDFFHRVGLYWVHLYGGPVHASCKVVGTVPGMLVRRRGRRVGLLLRPVKHLLAVWRVRGYLQWELLLIVPGMCKSVRCSEMAVFAALTGIL